MAKRKPKIKIFVSHHKPGYIYEDDIFVPIHVGKKNATIDLGILGDDTGDNISHKNPTYAELTAQYRVRKNYDLSNVDYVGFCHYRRYFTYCYKPTLKDYFRTTYKFGHITQLIYHIISTLFFNKIIIKNFSKQILEKNSKDIRRHITGDIILDIPPYVKKIQTPLNFDIPNVKMHKFITDFFIDEYPYEYECYINTIKSHRRNSCNLFIMKKEFFIEYSERLFEFLFKLENKIGENKINAFKAYGDQRFYGMLSERLLNAYIYKKEKEHVKISKNANLLFFQ